MEEEIAAIIKSAEVFNRCTLDEARNLLAPYVRLEHRPARNFIHRAGQSADGVKIITSGCVKEYQTNSIGKELITEMATKGNLVGMEDILFGGEFTQHALTLEDSAYVVIAAEDVRFLIKNNPHFANEMVAYTIRRLRTALKMQMSYLYQPVRQRVANSLLDMYMRWQRTGRQRPIQANRSQIAGMAGVTRETATRMVKEFEHEHLLTIDERGILITNPDKIQAIGRQYD